MFYADLRNPALSSGNRGSTRGFRGKSHPAKDQKSDHKEKCSHKNGRSLIARFQRIILNAGAGFLVVTTGAIMRMPGLPKKPAAYTIDVVDGKITGLS